MTKILIAIIALTALASSLVAQTTNAPVTTNPPPVSATPPKDLLPPEPTRPTNSNDRLKPVITIVAPTVVPTAKKPDRPARPADTPPTADVKSLVERFQKARDEIIKQKPILLRPDPISEQLRIEWLEKRSALREEFRARLSEIRNEFRNRELGEVLDAARDAAQRAKPRVGED